MITEKTTPKSIDEYIAAFPQEIQEVLESIRQTIRQAAPDAEETISYKIPTFTLHGNLVHFSAYRHHIGFYPGATCIEVFKRSLLEYKSAKGSVQFPLGRPMPYALISKMVGYRVKENLEKAAAKKKR